MNSQGYIYVLSLLITSLLYSCDRNVTPLEKVQAENIHPKVFSPILKKAYDFTYDEVLHSELGFYKLYSNIAKQELQIGLFRKDKYEIKGYNCMASFIDSGTYHIKSDTLFFSSLISNNQLDSNGFIMVDSSTTVKSYRSAIKRAFFQEGKIGLFRAFRLEYAYKLGVKHFCNEKLDSTGQGEGIRIDEMGRIVERGVYENYVLKNGNCYDFDGKYDRIGKKTRQPFILEITNFSDTVFIP